VGREKLFSFFSGHPREQIRGQGQALPGQASAPSWNHRHPGHSTPPQTLIGRALRGSPRNRLSRQPAAGPLGGVPLAMEAL
jgi:hypothetical protein